MNRKAFAAGAVIAAIAATTMGAAGPASASAYRWKPVKAKMVHVSHYNIHGRTNVYRPGNGTGNGSLRFPSWWQATLNPGYGDKYAYMDISVPRSCKALRVYALTYMDDRANLGTSTDIVALSGGKKLSGVRINLFGSGFSYDSVQSPVSVIKAHGKKVRGKKVRIRVANSGNDSRSSRDVFLRPQLRCS